MKLLTLHQPSVSTEDGRHISTTGAQFANAVAFDLYPRKQKTHVVFHSPSFLSLQTLSYMMFDASSFDESIQHPEPINGLGGHEVLEKFFSKTVIKCIPEHGQLGAILKYCSPDKISKLTAVGREAILHMFSFMSAGQRGVGVFHEPFISLTAYGLGHRTVEELGCMESITFAQEKGGAVTVFSVNTIE